MGLDGEWSTILFFSWGKDIFYFLADQGLNIPKMLPPAQTPPYHILTVANLLYTDLLKAGVNDLQILSNQVQGLTVADIQVFFFS